MVDLGWNPPEEFEEYRLIRLLGRGATGAVYLAHDALLDRAVAVKFVHAAADPAARPRFFNEARAIAKLQHANVVAVYRIGEVAGHPYLVSEYVPGRSLDQLDHPTPARQVVELALDLARGLAAAHRCGVLHRDVKPANAILTGDGHAKLLDFGLAAVDGAPPAAGPPRERFDPRAQRELTTTETLPASDARDPAPATERDGDMPIDQLVGTPLYMAPELWRGEPATRRSDLYALGILLYELVAGAAPYHGVPLSVLRGLVGRRDLPRLGELAPGTPPALAAIIDRLVERDASARFTSADELLVALEECAAPTVIASVPAGNPYRGLSAFDSAHASLFFGRRAETRELVDRVHSEAFVVVGGDSGTGKSSLCRAGVLPWLVDHEGWSRVDVVPGRQPIRALAAALAGWLETDEATISAQLRDIPDALARMIRQRASSTDRGRRLLLFVDQLEELLTLSDPDEARVVAAALAALAVRAPSVRVLATARSDFLSRLAMLPGLGDEMAHGLYFLRPLTSERIREVVVRPAAAKGVAFESEALVDRLVAQTELAPGGLPLLQFTLAEVWDSHDVEAKLVRTASLDALGGVAGALTRHADRLLEGLTLDERDAARRVLLRLVTAGGTAARRSEAELLSDGAAHGAERAALEALVRGRVIVAKDAQRAAYELAHEALLASWATLQGWLEQGKADHAVRLRVEQASTEWLRMGRARELLWTARQLAEARAIDRETLAARDAAFLATSRAVLVRRRVLGAGLATVLVVIAIVVGLTIRMRARHELDSVIANQVQAATTAATVARRLAQHGDVARTRAFELFDHQRWGEGEDAWTAVEALATAEASQYRTASTHLESALVLQPGRADLRGQLADLTFERLLRAERAHQGDLVEELTGRLAADPDDRRRVALGAPARIELAIDPPNTRVWLERPGAARQLLGQAPLPAFTMPTGSITLAFEAPDRIATRLPVLLSRGETFRAHVVLVGSAPAGMIYVPAGRFLFGSTDSTDLRRGFLNAAPTHEVETAAYFIARNEITFGQWIEFLDELGPAERRRRSPSVVSTQSSLTLIELAPKRWRLMLTPTTHTYLADSGEQVRYEHR
ncbi:MAG: protein kinase, partial [Kofleriaceae bacterium]